MEYISEIASFLVGAISGSLLTIYIKNQRASGNGSVVDQSKSISKGDTVGRDKITNRQNEP